MSELFLTSYGILWLLVVLLIAMVLLLYRQFGLMLMPGTRRADLGGLDVGATAPPLALEFLQDGRRPVLAWDREDLKSAQVGWVALFASPRCPICERLWEAKPLEELAGSWPNVEFIWIDALSRGGNPPRGWEMAVSEGHVASAAMDVPAFPFAYAIKPGGSVTAKRLVNDPESLGLLVEEAFDGEGNHAED